MKEEISIENDICILKFKNETTEDFNYKKAINSRFIQFHYLLKGKAVFKFNQGSYKLTLNQETSLLLFNPNKDLPMDLYLTKQSWLISIIVSVKKFHSLFTQEAHFIPFINDENKNKKYYADEAISPSMAVVLNQIMNYNVHNSLMDLYHKAKTYELLCLHFNKSGELDTEQCPFLASEDNIDKIKKAKKIIIERLTEPPTLQELSTMVGLSLQKLKEGFKHIYGEPVFTFLLHYKMELACTYLSQDYNVNEVALKIGYSTSSHFISAFKKRYGITPNQYKKG